MSFKTKIDLSNNRFFRQDIDSVSDFKGINRFSTPLSERHLGPNLEKLRTETLDTNIYSTFIYDKETNTYRFDLSNKELSVNLDQIIELGLNPYDEDTYHTQPKFEGIEPYIIENETFYQEYIGYGYDFTLEVINESFDQIYGQMIVGEFVKYIADSKDYDGNNDVVTVHGNINAERVRLGANYFIEDINDNTIISEYANVIYNYSAGTITIPENTKIGWNAYFYGSNLIFENETEIQRVGAPAVFNELIKISNDIYILK